MHSRIANVNGIELHYLDFGCPQPGAAFAVLMHGLTANAHAFDGVVAAGLTQHLHVVSVDLRGRGESDKPVTGYSMGDHARDIVGLLDVLNQPNAILIGHSFGGLLSLCLGATYPNRVAKIVLLDAAMRMHPNTRAMLGNTLARLGKTWPSFDDYLAQIRSAPYLKEAWSDEMLSYYRADVVDLADESYCRETHVPTLLLNATGEYALGAPLLPAENAHATAQLMTDCRVGHVRGNHQTMLYGAGAADIVAAIQAFL